MISATYIRLDNLSEVEKRYAYLWDATSDIERMAEEGTICSASFRNPKTGEEWFYDKDTGSWCSYETLWKLLNERNRIFWRCHCNTKYYIVLNRYSIRKV